MEADSIWAIVGAALALVILLALFIYSMKKTWQEISAEHANRVDRTQVTALEQDIEPSASVNTYTSTPRKDATLTEVPSTGIGNQGFNGTLESKVIEVEINTPVNGIANEDSTTAL